MGLVGKGVELPAVRPSIAMLPEIVCPPNPPERPM